MCVCVCVCVYCICTVHVYAHVYHYMLYVHASHQRLPVIENSVLCPSKVPQSLHAYTKYMYVHICAWNTYMLYICTYVRTYEGYTVHTYVYTYVCTYVLVCVGVILLTCKDTNGSIFVRPIHTVRMCTLCFLLNIQYIMIHTYIHIICISAYVLYVQYVLCIVMQERVRVSLNTLMRFPIPVL